MDNPYTKRKGGNGDAGRKAEKKTAKRLGGKQTIGSGALDIGKADIKVNSFLIESKSTVKDSYKLDLTVLCKIKGEAIRAQKEPALAINFTTGNGSPKTHGSWVCIEERAFKEYMEWREEQNER